jgi:hypothetical protein
MMEDHLPFPPYRIHMKITAAVLKLLMTKCVVYEASDRWQHDLS